MEELLNKLIEKGWKPFGKSNRGNVTIDKTIKTKSPFFDFDYHNMSVSTRELISKESGLWQFVCENGMVKDENLKYTENDLFNYYQDNYHYRIIASALTDEDKLEDFILSNIKLD